MRWNRIAVALISLAAFLLLFIVLQQRFLLNEAAPVKEEGKIVAQRNNNFILGSERYQREVNSIQYGIAEGRKTSVPTLSPIDEFLVGINYHEWHEVCGKKIQNIANHPLFPNYPSTKKVLLSLEDLTFKPATGFRLFGFLVPVIDGPYQFLVKTDMLDLQLWISLNMLPVESKLIWPRNGGNVYNNLGRDSSVVIQMQKSSHYFEILGKTDEKPGRFKMMWLVPGEKDFSRISESNFRLYIQNDFTTDSVVDLDFNVEPGLPMHIRTNYSVEYYSVDRVRRRDMFKYSFVPQEDVDNILDECPYDPSYIVRGRLRRYGGVWETHYSAIYPYDGSDMRFALKDGKFQTIFGNDLLNENEAMSVVDKVMKAIERKNKRKYVMRSVFNVELNRDSEKGNRYLVELELLSTDTGRSYRFSEYVFMPSGKQDLCFPSQFRWNKTADVNVILTVGNQGRWLKDFIDQMSRIYRVTKDQHLNVIVVDFSSRDIDPARALRESGLNRYVLVMRKGNFHKTAAIQEGIALIKDANAITLQVDLHLVFPDDFIDNVRKHCVQGKMAYSPVLTRLQCGGIPQQPTGSWEEVGYGIFGIYKSDWDSFGGMNVDAFQNQWGGEDWDLLDRVLRAGFEVERLKVPYFSHIFHSKKGMWHDMKTNRRR